MILNKKPTNEKKTEEELSRYFSILKSLLFEVERNIPCVRHIKMKPSKSTDSFYATVYFNDIPQALKLTVRHHTKRIQEKDYQYFFTNYRNIHEFQLTLIRDIKYAYSGLKNKGILLNQNRSVIAYDNSTSNRQLGTVQKKKNKTSNKLSSIQKRKHKKNKNKKGKHNAQICSR